MSDKKTAEEIAKTIPCQCSDCGMRESEATQMIQAYADQELASLREQLTNEKDHSNDLFNNLVQVQKQLKQKEDENRELVNEIDQLILHAEEDSLTYSVLEHARKLVFKTNHPDGYKKAN